MPWIHVAYVSLDDGDHWSWSLRQSELVRFFPRRGDVIAGAFETEVPVTCDADLEWGAPYADEVRTQVEAYIAQRLTLDAVRSADNQLRYPKAAQDMDRALRVAQEGAALQFDERVRGVVNAVAAVSTIWHVRPSRFAKSHTVSGGEIVDEVRRLLQQGRKPTVTYVITHTDGASDAAIEAAIYNAQTVKEVVDGVVRAATNPEVQSAEDFDRRVRGVR